MPLYVAEFQFRHNNRFNADMFGTAISRCEAHIENTLSYCPFWLGGFGSHF